MRRVRDRLVLAQGGLTRADRADLCAGFQAAVAETLAARTARACAGFRQGWAPARPVLAVGGGVAVNARVRAGLAAAAAAEGFDFVAPPPALCTDNGAMIAWAAAERMAVAEAGRAGAAGAAALAARRAGGADARRRAQGGQGVIGVIGAGAFGTALAVAEAAEGREVALWGRDATGQAAAEAARASARLPGVRLPDGLGCVSDLAALADAEAVLLVLPAQATEPFLAAHGRELPDAPLVVCAKGVDARGQRLQTGIAAVYLPGRALAALTGPGFAAEIAAGLPTALTPRLRRPGPRARAAGAALDAAAAALPDRRPDRGAARRGAEERRRHRLRHRRGRAASAIRRAPR